MSKNKYKQTSQIQNTENYINENMKDQKENPILTAIQPQPHMGSSKAEKTIGKDASEVGCSGP
jgi:hypothetical protein